MQVSAERKRICLETIQERCEDILAGAKPLKRSEAKELLSRLSPRNPLSPEDAARFMVTDDHQVTLMLRERALRVKEEVFGKRIVLFAPLYLSSRCLNNCLYCGFRRENREIERKTLSPAEAAREAELLAKRGYRRLLLVCGESYREGPAEYITSVVREIYAKTDIRILHVNAAPMEVEDLRRIKREGVGVFQVFQETYHRETYSVMHPSGRKSDYLYRLTCMDRAMEAGFDDVGIGALLGLYDWKFDVLATILHGHYLRDKYGTYPHTISVPRLKPAKGAVVTEAPHPVSDRDFLKIVALYRLTCPTSGVVISTREPALLREESLFWGASQISAGSSTTPGGYGEAREREEEGQFFVDDKRPLKEVVKRVEEVGLIPSLCTSCYRSGRTGASFTSLAASGKMGKFCAVNALLTLAEYALDVLEGEEREKALALVRRESENLPPDLKRPFSEKLERVEKGERDVRF